MATLYETLASYVPAMVIRRHSANSAPITNAAGERFDGALLYADISGFTALAERLAQRGPAGAEDLSAMLNDAFGRLTATITAFGGDTVKFAGDALLALWPASAEAAHPNDRSALAIATLRAAECGLALQAILRSSDASTNESFAIRIGIGAGTIDVMHLGGVYGRWELLVAGAPLRQTSAAQRGQPGEVVLSPEAALREASSIFTQAVALAREARPEAAEQLRQHTVALTRLLGETHHLMGEFTTARDYFQQSLAAAEALGDRKSAANALSRLGRLATDAGDYATARQYLERSLALARGKTQDLAIVAATIVGTPAVQLAA